MLRAIQGPLIVEPSSWILVFDRSADRQWLNWISPGPYKHVRAYAYVPYLHVWVFIDPRFDGLKLTVAAHGDASALLAAQWATGADRIRMTAQHDGRLSLPIFGWCVPIIKRMLGLRCVALTPSGLFTYCLENGGEPFEVGIGHPKVIASPA